MLRAPKPFHKCTRRLYAPFMRSSPAYSSVLGIGTDLVYLPRFTRLLEKMSSFEHKERFHKILRKFMHPREILCFDQMRQRDASPTALSNYAAGIWATKEAVFKSLVAQKNDVVLPPAQFIYTKMCFKSNDTNGAPYLEIDKEQTLLRPEFEKAYIRNSKFLLSISHDGDYLVSYV